MIIAHDLGTTGNKASLHHDDGRLIAAVTVPYPAHFAAGGVAEQDPADWWHAVVTATRDLLARTGTAEVASDPMPPNISDAYVMLKPMDQWPQPRRSRDELIAANRSDEEIRVAIGADELIYQTLDMLKASITACNPSIEQFETSCFDGCYVTGDVTAAYLDGVENQRKGAPRQSEDDSGQLDLNLVTSEENA